MWLETEASLALSIWWHQFSTGSLLLFAFFMISDPMTTPRTRSLRVAYAVLVALAAFVWQFVLYKPHGLIVMLLLASPLVPLLNRWRPGERPQWLTASGRSPPPSPSAAPGL
ncbi:RnfABCDGE type electron transport complex subunit D [Ideonella paludis]|uniref:RnfABCDGE type electron transport complex subunit D n=1 Tax=Ideonella paludis TaxID=1233411 RepID=UPI003625B176